MIVRCPWGGSPPRAPRGAGISGAVSFPRSRSAVMVVAPSFPSAPPVIITTLRGGAGGTGPRRPCCTAARPRRKRPVRASGRGNILHLVGEVRGVDRHRDEPAEGRPDVRKTPFQARRREESPRDPPRDSPRRHQPEADLPRRLAEPARYVTGV